MMPTSRLTLFALILTALGCRSMSSRPDPDWNADFDRAKVLSIGSVDGVLDVSDPGTIEQLSRIYTDAKWVYSWNTYATYPDDTLVLLSADGAALRTFHYNGSLWELDDRNGVRIAELSETDRSWIELLFARLPDSDG